MSAFRALLADPVQGPFIAEIAVSRQDHPRHTQALLVYADWLEDRGDERAELIRLGIELGEGTGPGETIVERARRFHELRTRADRDWYHVVFQRKSIITCGQAELQPTVLRFSFECPKVWEELSLTGDATIRYCAGCRQTVHRCETIEQAEAHAGRGECVSISLPVEHEVCNRYMSVGDDGVQFEVWGRDLAARRAQTSVTGMSAPPQDWRLGRVQLRHEPQPPSAPTEPGSPAAPSPGAPPPRPVQTPSQRSRRRWWQFWR